MKKTLLRIVLFSFVLFSAQTVFGQGVTSSTIVGTVTDQTGFPLVGATVRAIHEPSGTNYGIITNAKGRFTLPGLRVGGPYTVRVTYVGYQEQKFENITLALGATKVINASLKEGLELEEIEVVASSDDVFNSDKTGATTNLSNERISSLPTINRNINDFTRLVPQSNGTSFGGADNRYNNYTIDGNLYNNNFGLGSAQFAGGNPISLDAIEEVQVNIAPYDVTQSGFTGANVNAVTKSGTNQIEATAYTLFRNQNTQGTTLNGGQEVPFAESKTQIHGFTLGAPIIKDKLFFFGSFEYENNAIPGDNRRAARPDEGLFPDFEQRIARMTADQAQFVREQMREIYGYETGAFENYPFSDVATRLNLRLDYNLDRRNKIMVRFNSFLQTRDVGINGNSIRGLPQSERFRNTDRFGPEALTFRNGNYGSESNVQSIVAEWNSTIGSNMANRLNIGYTSAVSQRFIPGEQTFPMSEILEYDGSTPLYFASLGTELFTRGNLLDNKTFNITNNFNYFLGNHTFTAGVNLEFMTFENAFNPVWDSWYRWGSYDDFVGAVINQDPTIRPAGFAIGYSYDANNPFELPVDFTRFGQAGIYLQDEFQVNRDLKLTGGIRVELPFYPIDAPRNPEVEALGISVENPRNPGEFVEPRVDQFPSVNPVFSPRFGFNWDPIGDGTIQVRGGTGIFTGRPIFVHLSNQINGNGVTRGFNGILPDQWGTEGFPEWDGFQADINYYRPNPAEQEPTVSSSLSITDPEFSLPQTWRSNLAVDYKYAGFVFTLEGIYSRDYNSPFSANLSSIPTGESILVGGNEYPTYDQIRLGERINELYYLTNINDRTYTALTFNVEKDWGKGIYTSLAYTRSQTRDFGLIGGSQAASLWPDDVQRGRNNPEAGFSRFDQPNRVVGLVSFNTKGLNESNNTSLNIFYTAGEQGRFSYTYSGNMTGEGSGTSLMYIPESFEDAQLVDRISGGAIVQTAEEQWGILNNYIENDPYLSANRGAVSERNGATLPWLHRMDVSLVQDINLTKDANKHRLQFRADILNFLNMIRDSWGVSRSTVQRNLLNFEGVDENGNAQFTINPVQGESDYPTEISVPNFNLGQTWSAQFGVKYIF